MNTWGNKIRLSIFGESHGTCVGITIDGLPAGINLDCDLINFELKRRAPSANISSTQRSEKDDFEIISGLFEEKTTGAPLTAIFRNNDTKSKDYSKIKNILRPSHADYPAKIKFKSFNDYRGGGHFSGRMTVALVFAGAICKQILKEKNIEIYSHIKKISKYEDEKFLNNDIDKERLTKLKNKYLPLLDKSLEEQIENYLKDVKIKGDSVGGLLECMALNLPLGLGEPFFESFESKLASLVFSIPAVKGIEFGLGFDFASACGSSVNDEYYINEGIIKTKTNNNGGILGGLTNAMPLVFSVVVKATPSILLKQRTVDIAELKETSLEIKGRHDVCILPRIIPVIEAVTAITICDLM